MSLLINSTSLGNIIIATGSFILLLVLIRLFAWKQITGIFAARAEKIAKDIDGAEEARQKAEQLEQKRQTELAGAKEDASKIITDAKEIGQAQGDKLIDEAREEASRLKDKAQADIAQSKTEAISSVKAEMSDLTVTLAERIMGAHLDKEAQSQLNDRYLDDLGEA